MRAGKKIGRHEATYAVIIELLLLFIIYYLLFIFYYLLFIIYYLWKP